jgi:RNA polymerase sigma-70 factor (sigma-E family)
VQPARDDEFERFAVHELVGLLRYAVMLTGDPELARDLVQDVMVKAYSQWKRVGAADRPDRYVKVMVTREHLMWRRRWAVRHVFPAAVLVDQPSAQAEDDYAAVIADRDDLWQRLAKLPRRQRAVLVLRYYEQLTDAEIAQVLRCSAGTVRGYASRALATLRLELQAEPAVRRETT